MINYTECLLLDTFSLLLYMGLLCTVVIDAFTHRAWEVSKCVEMSV